jgi:NhaP-type Na+/H+ or K+/H+ antiporter
LNAHCLIGCIRVRVDLTALTALLLTIAGVVAVAVFGLYGSATSKFDISAKLQESGAFEDFWDTFAFVANGIVFFFAGASSMNFVIR